ncbi:hypothetical protein AVEN_135214-1 [Araneus ventricosus]|uniref:Uncharacterized protein n=1 Tax=Araneus ventricosus TaxID=182803 RepID=A0A4Y2IIS6_ARAVE|nr:hypothetical protein AVEN_258729-1 [Araneus ventricosus]GBM77656.1 hypothetical protein AVEN_132054-1 [Araneus ventricosus]GBM77661.1 hypothetical protein AVEN_150733-1 [Araneus ventricosus]GBM82841.1 hypothetical protein AVEN_135214-1 [Araneus ventricosus]
MTIINSWSWYKRDAYCSGILQKNQMDLLDFTFKVSYLSFSNQCPAPPKCGYPSGNNPAVTPPKKKLNPSVRPYIDGRFDGINHMIERSSKQERFKLWNIALSKLHLFLRNVEHIYVFMLNEIV